MIVKKVKNPKQSSSKAQRAGLLIDYIEDELTLDGADKVLYRGARNFMSGNPLVQQHEMIALAHTAERSKDPICHYVLSWRAGEQPTTAQVEQCVDILLSELGVSDHQVIYALHGNTGHTHLHVVLNRVHPDTEKVKCFEYDIQTCHKAIARIEQTQGWQREPNHLYEVNGHGHAVPRDFTKQPRQKEKDPHKPRNQAADQHEQRHGTKSAERIAKEVAVPLIKSAKSWQALHESLAANGFKYERKGSGALLYVNDQPIKASTADRSCSLSSLEKRLGTYEPPNPNLIIKKRPVELLPNIKKDLWQQYTDEKKVLYAKKQKLLAELRKRHADERKAFQNKWKNELQNLYKHNWRGRGAALNAMRSVIAAQKAIDRLNMKDRHDRERKALFETFEPILDFRAWQRKRRQPEQQEQRRHAYFFQPSNPNAPSSQPKADLRDFKHRVHADKVEYYRPSEPKPSFIDHGQTISIQDTKPDSLLAALQLSQSKWGSFVVHGSDEFKQQCVKLAVLHHFKITNPELQDDLLKERMKLQVEQNRAKQHAQVADHQPKPTQPDIADVAHARAKLPTDRERLEQRLITDLLKVAARRAYGIKLVDPEKISFKHSGVIVKFPIEENPCQEAGAKEPEPLE